MTMTPKHRAFLNRAIAPARALDSYAEPLAAAFALPLAEAEAIVAEWLTSFDPDVDGNPDQRIAAGVDVIALCIYCEAPVRREGQFIAEACEHCEREVLTDNPYLLGSEA